jgi:hypothetical protein
LEASLPFSDSSYMTAAKTLFTWISLLATIHPRPEIYAMNGIYVQTIPLATFDDLQEAMSLIEHNNGVRSYILKWYNDVFLPAYESKIGPDSKQARNGNLLTENRIAVTTRDLIEKTAEVENKRLGSKSILETYINPLINLNVISNEPSVLDGRANIYYPVKSKNQNRNIFDYANSINISDCFRIRVENSIAFPNEIYIMHEINRVLNYSSDKRDRLVDHNGIERSVQEIVNRYYTNFDDCFTIDNRSGLSHSSLRYDFLISDHISREYCYSHQNDKQLQSSSEIYAKSAIADFKQFENIIESSKTNNLLYLDENDSQRELEVENTARQTSAVEFNEISLDDSTSTTDATLTLGMIDRLFMYDSDLPYRLPPPHTLDESPFRWIIKQDNNQFYYCTLHSNEKNINLETIEHHIIHSNPTFHKTEIKKIFGYLD